MVSGIVKVGEEPLAAMVSEGVQCDPEQFPGGLGSQPSVRTNLSSSFTVLPEANLSLYSSDTNPQEMIVGGKVGGVCSLLPLSEIHLWWSFYREGTDMLWGQEGQAIS